MALKKRLLMHRKAMPSRNWSGLPLQASMKASQQGVFNVDFICGDIEEVNFGRASFDVLLAANAMPYMQHYERTLQRTSCWLRHGGRLCFSMPKVRNARLLATLIRPEVTTNNHVCCLDKQPSLNPSLMQVPMLQAHATFQRLLCSMTGLTLTEAAGELATRDGIINLLSNAGYRNVQVMLSVWKSL